MGVVTSSTSLELPFGHKRNEKTYTFQFCIKSAFVQHHFEARYTPKWNMQLYIFYNPETNALEAISIRENAYAL